MVSVVSQMLRQDLNTLRGLSISDPHHLAVTFYLRGLLNTSILPTTKKNTQFQGNFSTHRHIQKPWRTFQTPSFFVLPPTILHLKPWRIFKSPPFFIPPPTIFHTQKAPCSYEHHHSQQFMCCIRRNPLGGGGSQHM